jgi:hypothetical protein
MYRNSRLFQKPTNTTAVKELIIDHAYENRRKSKCLASEKKPPVHVNCHKYDQRKVSIAVRPKVPLMMQKEGKKNGEKLGKLVPLRV